MDRMDLNLFLRSRVDFFRRFHSERTTEHFLQNESQIISLIASERNAALLRNINISLMPLSGFFDPVTVSASDTQISASLLPSTGHIEGSCAICLEDFADGGDHVRLRNCNHCFHRNCARSWYHMSVYCPVCRNDIRTTNA